MTFIDFVKTAAKFKQVKKDPPTKNITKQTIFNFLFFNSWVKFCPLFPWSTVEFLTLILKAIRNDMMLAIELDIKK